MRANVPGKLLGSPFGVEGQRAERNESSSVCHNVKFGRKVFLMKPFPFS